MTDYKRIIIAQFGVTQPLTFFGGYRGLVWVRTLSITQDIIDTSFWTQNFGATFDDTTLTPFSINTVSWNGRQLDEIDNLDDLFLVDVVNAFYMDFDNQKLYIKNFDYLPPWQTPDLVSGVISGATNVSDVDENGRPYNSTFGGLQYDERLIDSSLSNEKRLDNWNNNFMQFGSFNFSMENPDGRFDHVRDDVINQTAKLLMAEVPATKEVLITDFEVIGTGAIRDVGFPDASTVTVGVEDIRGNWTDIFPKTVYTSDFLGFIIDDRLVGKNMPVVFGPCLKVPAYRLEADGLTFHVSWADEEHQLTSIDSIYWDDNGTYTELDKASFDLSNGTITLQNAQEFTGAVLYADMVGHIAPSISQTDPVGGTALDVAIFILRVFSGRTFISSYFNVEHIREVRDRRPYQVGIAFPVEGAELSLAIEACTFSINTVFFTNRTVLDIGEMTVDLSSPFTIYTDDLDNSPPIVWDKSDYMSRISTGYAENYHTKVFKTIHDTQFEESAQARYILTKQYDFNTSLVNETDAYNMGLERYEWGVLIRPEIVVQFGGPIEFNFLDVVFYDYIQFGRQRLEPALYRVTSINEIQNQVTLTFIESQATILNEYKLRGSK